MLVIKRDCVSREYFFPFQVKEKYIYIYNTSKHKQWNICEKHDLLGQNKSNLKWKNIAHFALSQGKYK